MTAPGLVPIVSMQLVPVQRSERENLIVKGKVPVRCTDSALAKVPR